MRPSTESEQFNLDNHWRVGEDFLVEVHLLSVMEESIPIDVPAVYNPH